MNDIDFSEEGIEKAMLELQKGEANIAKLEQKLLKEAQNDPNSRTMTLAEWLRFREKNLW